MNKSVGAYEAKTHLPQLLERVSRGEKITITRHGIPIAMLVPATVKQKETEIHHAIEEMKKFRQEHSLNGLRVRETMEEWTPVVLSETDMAIISERAKSIGCSPAQVIHFMCEDLRKKNYLEELGETFDLLRADSNKFAEFQAEQKIWDITLSDGLEDAY